MVKFYKGIETRPYLVVLNQIDSPQPSGTPKHIVDKVAEGLKEQQVNLSLPIVCLTDEEDKYHLMSGAAIHEAAKSAGLTHIWVSMIAAKREEAEKYLESADLQSQLNRRIGGEKSPEKDGEVAQENVPNIAKSVLKKGQQQSITRKELFTQVRNNPAKLQQVRSALGKQWNRKPTEAIAQAIGLQITSSKSIAGANRARSTTKRHGFAKSFAAENASKHLEGNKDQVKAQILKAINRDLKKAEKSKGEKLTRDEKRATASRALKNEVAKIRSGKTSSKRSKQLR